MNSMRSMGKRDGRDASINSQIEEKYYAPRKTTATNYAKNYSNIANKIFDSRKNSIDHYDYYHKKKPSVEIK
jgi:hypothetical protein